MIKMELQAKNGGGGLCVVNKESIFWWRTTINNIVFITYKLIWYIPLYSNKWKKINGHKMHVGSSVKIKTHKDTSEVFL